MNETNQLQALFRDPSRAGVYHLPLTGPAQIIATAQDCDYAIFRIDLAAVTDKTGLLAALARDMALPEWFGHNWDALADCLADLSWRPAEGYLVLLEHSDLLRTRAEADFVAALRLFADAAEEWREQGVAFWCLVDMQADGISWLPGL